MPATTDKVHQLVQQLTKSEKRYFYRYAHTHREESPNYWKVYTILEEMGQWDPQLFNQQLADVPFYKHLPVVKTQLYERLLDALHLFHRHNELDEQLKMQLHQSYLLLRRGLIAAAHQRLVKTRKDIQRFGLWQFWPECMEIERLIQERLLREGQKNASFESWANDYQMGLNHLEASIPMAQMKGELSALHLSRVRPQAAQLDALKKQIEPLGSTAAPGMATDFYQSQALLAFMGRKIVDARAANAALLSTLESMPSTQRTVPERTLSTLYNYLVDQLQLDESLAFQEGLSKLRKLPQRKGFRQVRGIEAKIFEWGFQLELNYWVQQKGYAQAFHLLPAVADGLKTHTKQLSSPAVTSLRHLSGLIAFHSKKSDLALTFLTPLYQEGRTDVAHEIYHFAQILYLLCHFEEGHLQLLDHLLTRFQRQIRASKTSYESTRHCLQFLRRLIQSPRNEHVQIWQQWLKQLPAENDPILLYLDLRSWILSKLPTSK